MVNFGPEDQLQNIDPKKWEGKEVTLLAHRVTIGGATSLVARQMRVDDQTIDTNWSKLRQAQADSQQQSQ